MKISTKQLAYGALIAAAYAALVLFMQPIAFGGWQFRVSEALSVLPFFMPAAVPGMFIGCIIANLSSPFGLLDIICGSLATLGAAFWTYKIKNIYLAPLPSVILNALVVPAVICIGSGEFSAILYLTLMAQIGLTQFAVCYGLGLPLLLILRSRNIFGKGKDK